MTHANNETDSEKGDAISEAKHRNLFASIRCVCVNKQIIYLTMQNKNHSFANHSTAKQQNIANLGSQANEKIQGLFIVPRGRQLCLLQSFC